MEREVLRIGILNLNVGIARKSFTPSTRAARDAKVGLWVVRVEGRTFELLWGWRQDVEAVA